MTIERAAAAMGGEHLPPTGMRSGAPDDGVTPATRLQILSAEHWSLLASRSLAWNEVFARAGTYLSALSGAIVALALAGQGTGFGDAFLLFGLVILPVVLFIGIGTWLRMGSSNYHDAQCVIGMNRIRGAYLELAPELEPYFVMSAHDDWRGVDVTMAVEPGTPPIVHLIASTPFLVVVLNAAVGAAIVGMVAAYLHAAGGLVILAGVVGFGVVLTPHLLYARKRIARLQGGLSPRFPSS